MEVKAYIVVKFKGSLKYCASYYIELFRIIVISDFVDPLTISTMMMTLLCFRLTCSTLCVLLNVLK